MMNKVKRTGNRAGGKRWRVQGTGSGRKETAMRRRAVVAVAVAVFAGGAAVAFAGPVKLLSLDVPMPDTAVGASDVQVTLTWGTCGRLRLRRAALSTWTT